MPLWPYFSFRKGHCISIAYSITAYDCDTVMSLSIPITAHKLTRVSKQSPGARTNSVPAATELQHSVPKTTVRICAG